MRTSNGDKFSRLFKGPWGLFKAPDGLFVTCLLLDFARKTLKTSKLD